MKCKKIFITLSCYLTLIAFFGIIAVQFSSSSKFNRAKVEVSTTKSGINSDLAVVFEEEQDSDDFLSDHFISSSFSQYVYQSHLYFNSRLALSSIDRNFIPFKISPFLANRVLRI